NNMLIDDIIIDVLILLFIYLIIFCIYYAFSVFVATKKKQIGMEHKYLAQELPSNLIVIVYADNADKSVVRLSEALKNQNYPKENYNVHVLFDNVNDEVTDEVCAIENVKVWKINKGAKMGKDDALSWLLEKFISFRNVNGFVFLDANREIDNNFLSEVNKALFWTDVVVSAKEYIDEPDNPIAAVKNQVLKYNNRIFNTSRTILKLMTPLESGAVAIKQEVLALVKCVDFEDKKSEYLYSLFLASKGHIPMFAPNVKSKIRYQDEKHLTFKDVSDIIKYGFSKLIGSNLKYAEFLLTFLRPSAMQILLLYLCFFAFLYNFEVKNMFFYDSKFIAGGAIATLVVFLFSLIVSADEKINPLLLIFYPMYKILEIIFPNKKEKKQQPEKEEKPVEPDNIGVGQDVKVSDGNQILKCALELKTVSDGKMAIFRYKDKKIESAVYSVPKHALSEISEKLTSFGLKLMVCSNCAHFSFKPNADMTKQNGWCSCKEKMTGDIQYDTTLLNSCEYFKTLADLDNVVDVDFNKNNEE
nr:hypothetical protein [Candidatus Gastranaerophilales bacterium]